MKGPLLAATTRTSWVISTKRAYLFLPATRNYPKWKLPELKQNAKAFRIFILSTFLATRLAGKQQGPGSIMKLSNAYRTFCMRASPPCNREEIPSPGGHVDYPILENQIPTSRNSLEPDQSRFCWARNFIALILFLKSLNLSTLDIKKDFPVPWGTRKTS